MHFTIFVAQQISYGYSNFSQHLYANGSLNHWLPDSKPPLVLRKASGQQPACEGALVLFLLLHGQLEFRIYLLPRPQPVCCDQLLGHVHLYHGAGALLQVPISVDPHRSPGTFFNAPLS